MIGVVRAQGEGLKAQGLDKLKGQSEKKIEANSARRMALGIRKLRAQSKNRGQGLGAEQDRHKAHG